MLNNCEVESAVAGVLEELSYEVFLLSFLSVGAGVSASALTDAVCNVLFSVLLVLHYRNVSYRAVVGKRFVRERMLKL